MSTHRVLVAEDNVEMRTLIVNALSHDGHRISSVGNGRELLNELASGEHYDLVVSDLRMPELSALDVLEARRHDAGPPFLILTAFPDEHALNEAARLGAVGVLAKPFELDDLRLAANLLVGGR